MDIGPDSYINALGLLHDVEHNLPRGLSMVATENFLEFLQLIREKDGLDPLRDLEKWLEMFQNPNLGLDEYYQELIRGFAEKSGSKYIEVRNALERATMAVLDTDILHVDWEDSVLYIYFINYMKNANKSHPSRREEYLV